MEFLTGTPIMVQLLQNRLVIKYEPSDPKFNPGDYNFDECKGLVYVTELDGRADTIELMFADKNDKIAFEEQFAAIKLSQD